MNSNQRNESLFNQIRSTLMSNIGPNYYGPIAAASAAVLGGALFYYFNNSSSASTNLLKSVVDHKHQAREVEVNFSLIHN